MALSPVFSNLIAAIRIPIDPAIPMRPLITPTKSADDIFFNANARSRIETLIPIIKEIVLVIPVNSLGIFCNIDKEPINSTNKPVIATKADANLSGSIVDRTKRAAANIPIADAIFNKVPAFN